MLYRRLERLSSWLLACLILSAPIIDLAQTTIPERLHQAIDRRYPGWKLATTRAGIRGQQVVRGDFNGDGLVDCAVQIVTASTASPDDDKSQVVVAGLQHKDGGFDLVEVTRGPVSDISSLVLAPRGERVPDLEADPNGEHLIRLAHDGIHVVYEEKGATTCQLKGAVFACQTSGD